MSIVKNFLPIFTKNQIRFKEQYREIGDIYTFVFEMDKQMSWKAGQHGIFTIHHIKINKPTRALSIASIPNEGNIKISTKISEDPSEFKKALLNLQPGMTISMRGPIGALYTQSIKPLLFIAGGIGITPFRAIIKGLLLNSDDISREIELIYMDSHEEFIYRTELDNADKAAIVKTVYTVNRKDLNDNIENFVDKHNNDAEYYIIGSKMMIKSINDLLLNKGIKKKNVRRDTFIGY